MVNKRYITWNNVEDYISKAVSLYAGDKISGVYGIPRGGSVLAVMLSHRLGIPLLAAPAPNCIITDDICDSGESLLHYDQNSSSLDKPTYHITTMIYKKGALVTPELYWDFKEDDWIVFPWEAK